MSTRPDSPIKQTFKKLLSPNKSKPLPPVVDPILSPHHQHQHQQQSINSQQQPSTYRPTSKSSSNYSTETNGNPIIHQYNTGWNVIDRPHTPTTTGTSTSTSQDANKENLRSPTTREVLER